MEATALGTLKRGYAACAQATGRLLERVGILDEDPPPRDHRLRHWAYSLTRAHDSIGISELDVPWWTYGAIDAVEELAGRSGRRCAGVRVGFGGEHDLVGPPGGIRALGRASRRVRHDDPGAAGGVAQRHAGHRRTRAERITGDQLGEGRPWRARLHRLRPPHRHDRRNVRLDRHRRPGPRGLSDSGTSTAWSRTGSSCSTTRCGAATGERSPRPRSTRRSTAASRPRSPTPTRPAS